MRLLLSSADRAQIERFAKILFVAGIQTHICGLRAGRNVDDQVRGAELWLNSERDYEAALMLFGGAVPAEIPA